MKTGGVIGLGGIGGGVAQCLQRSGQLAAIYDVRAEAAANVPGAPAMSASPRDLAAASDCVLIAVLNGAQTIAVLSGPDGVLAAGKPGQTVILLSTIAMSDLAAAQKLCADAGVTLIDCGVTNGPKSGQNGLICLVGGSDADIAAAKPIFDGFAGSIIHMGGPGAGMAAKIARNTTYFGCIRAGYEGAVIARNYGVDLAQMAKSLAGDPAAGGGLEGAMMLQLRPDPEGNAQETAAREYHYSLMLKDLDVAIAEAAKFGVRLPMVELLKEYGRSSVGLEYPLGQPIEG
ncbi:NAD(P)-dependent oxidoreductase [Novosphingobium sp. Fuku2-ISO-50]|uniref:NAD(P)-dependent oxidoreductase n=1 Tax=Novosphingobium sp. Fuku2-ISO-50 TaxID=1739114 RepID=UPI000AC2AEDA|nr:NAD(P)-binding domain-containing protein [Novosphingobium sp. Fuku2-ISO-50]